MKPIHDEFDISISDEVYTIDVADLIVNLKIDPVDIGDDLRDQPGAFAWVATVTAQAEFEAGRAKQRLVAVKATLGKELHAENVGLGRYDRLTEAAIEERVTTDECVMDLVDEYLDAARRAAILTGLREAYRQRKDMLNIIGYGTRQRQQAEE